MKKQQEDDDGKNLSMGKFGKKSKKGKKKHSRK